MTRKINARIEHDEDGWWAYYQPGRKSGTDPVGAQHMDSADTKRELMALVRDSIPCHCATCESAGRPKQAKE